MSTTGQTTETTTTPRPSSNRHSVLPPLRVSDFDRTGKLGSNIAMAVQALWANRLRSFLTLLGIFIGVASVIAAFTMTQGVGASFINTINGMGTNMIIISPGVSNSTSGSSGGGVHPGQRVSSAVPAAGAVQSLTPGDVQAMTTGPTAIPHVTAVSAIVSTNEQVVAGDQNWNTTVQGVNASFATIRNWNTVEGAWFSSQDDQAAHAVAVLGQTVAQNLFSDVGEDPIGQTIRIGNALYRVVGVLSAQGGASNSDNVVFVPYTSAVERLKNNGYVDQILVQVDSSNNINAVQQAITSLLEQRHHIAKGMADDFTITTSQQLLQTANQSLTLLTALLVGIASVSLTVGGIGIMNIMIVSVTERTREIGIRISIGAQRQDIRNQFLIEALILSLTGGVIGLLLGLVLGYEITQVFFVVPFVVTPVSLLLPFVVSAGIGVLFGFYPAARASRLDPIEALRSL
jgi:putative ABC transport system permease protein